MHSARIQKNILVTGGAGFIGSHLCEALLTQGHTVTCLDNFATGKYNNLSHLSDLRIIEGDANQAESYATLAHEKFDVVYHYAATVGVKRTEENPNQVLDDVSGFRILADLARRGWVKQIIFASSSEVYGQPLALPEKEEDGIYGWSPYTVVKLYGEQILRALWEKEGIPTVSLRFFNVYGPRQIGNGYGFVTATFMRQALQGIRPTVYGDGGQTRDFVYVADNVQAAVAAMSEPRAFGRAINVGTGVETNIRQLAELVIEAAQATSLTPEHVAARPVEIHRRCADVTKLLELVGVACTTPLAQGLFETAAWYKAMTEQSEKAVLIPQPATEYVPV